MSAQRWFQDGSPLPLGYPAIKAWSDLTNQTILPSEVNALIQMDDAYLREHGEESRAQMERQEERRKAQAQTKGRRR